MAEILDYQTPLPKAKNRGAAPAFLVAGVLPIVIIFLSTAMLDDGISSAICISAAGGFWVGATIVAVRRRRNLTATDRLFLIAGYPVLLVVPILLVVTMAAFMALVI